MGRSLEMLEANAPALLALEVARPRAVSESSQKRQDTPFWPLPPIRPLAQLEMSQPSWR